MVKNEFNIVEAGANIGYLSLNFAKRCPDGNVFCFEPDSENFRNLEENVRLNKFNNVTLFKNALGHSSYEAEIFRLYESNPGANRILSKGQIQNVESEMVMVRSLDEIDSHDPFPKIDLIKIDVEGFELFVLQGASSLISKWRPILFVELAEENLKLQGVTSLNLLEYLERLDYKIVDASTMKEPDRGIENHHTDIFCFPI
jgi:FkbM family methyltransferase